MQNNGGSMPESLLINRRDLDFQLFEVLQAEALAQRPRHADHSRETFAAALDTAHAIAEEKFAPHNRASDENEPRFENGRVRMIPEVREALDAFCAAGLLAPTKDYEQGGMQLPVVVAQACSALFKSANGATTSYVGLTLGNANVIERFGSEAQKRKYLGALLSGRFFGTMALTEPQAGSSLSDLTTSATLSGLIHKAGWRGTPSTMLSFGDQDACEGELVGQPHQGLACMFHMMNEARIGVGMGAVMYGYRGYLASLRYARERLQGRPPAAKDPLQPPVPLVAHADVRRMLLAQKAYVEGAFALGLYAARLVDEQRTGTSEAARAEAGLLLDLLTPIVKSWPAQWCLEANSLAIQIHGGYGYTREYPVEQFWRDNRLNMIHEGTHGIQALDLLGRKAVMQQGAAIALFGRELQATVEQARARPALAAHAEALQAAWGEVNATLAVLTPLLRSEGDRALANASVFLEAFGHTVLAWTWLRQAVVADGALAQTSVPHDADFYQGKLQACRWFFHWELPRTAAQHALLRSLDDSTLAMQAAWF